MTDADSAPEGTTHDAGPTGPPMNRMVIALLALIGLFVALYLWAYNAGLMGQIVCGVGDCGTVQSSEYATVGPVPVSAIGAIGYLVLMSLAFAGIQPSYRKSALIGALMLAGATFGVLFSGYLTYLEAMVIKAWCQYCVASAIIITLIFFATLPEIGRIRRASL